MTFPQLPLGDDGELDLETAENLITLEKLKRKRAPFSVKNHWPFLGILLMILVPVIYAGIGEFGAMPVYSMDYQQPINYPVVLAYNYAPYGIFFFEIMTGIVCFVGLFRRPGQGFIGVLAAILLISGVSLFSCFLCGVSVPRYYLLSHQQTIRYGNHVYHLALEEEFLDIGRDYIVFKCDSSGITCQSVYTFLGYVDNAFLFIDALSGNNLYVQIDDRKVFIAGH